MTQGTGQPFPYSRCSASLALTFLRDLALFRRAVRMGQHVWLLLATIGTELLAIVKWSKGQFPVPLPTPVRIAWLAGAALLVLYPVGQVSILYLQGAY